MDIKVNDQLKDFVCRDFIKAGKVFRYDTKTNLVHLEGVDEPVKLPDYDMDVIEAYHGHVHLVVYANNYVTIIPTYVFDDSFLISDDLDVFKVIGIIRKYLRKIYQRWE